MKQATQLTNEQAILRNAVPLIKLLNKLKVIDFRIFKEDKITKLSKKSIHPSYGKDGSEGIYYRFIFNWLNPFTILLFLLLYSFGWLLGLCVGGFPAIKQLYPEINLFFFTRPLRAC